MSKKEIKKRKFQLVRGMKDILPEDQRYWNFIRNKVDELAALYGFGRIDTPILEASDLFVRAVGQTTDIVEKEMYSFVDQGEDKLALRPENTAGVVRAYIEHGMLNLPQPVKLYYFGPMFRREKPQSGRYRQFWQFGFEVIGEKDAAADAQVILLSYKVYQNIGLLSMVQINSIGCSACRPEYVNQLKDYFKKNKNKLSEISRERLLKNPMRILDSKEKEDQEIVAQAPQQIDFLCEDCRNHFIQVLEYLDELEIPYALNPTIVRGLDYYSKTAFEVWSTEEEVARQSALGGGGRYDGLMEMLGGLPTPAVGFAGGCERLINQIKENDIKVLANHQPKIFLAQLGPDAKKKMMVLYEKILTAGIAAAENFSKNGLKQQLEQADKLGVKFTLILGQKELVDGTIMIRDMENGNQEIVDFQKIVSEIQKRLSKSAVSENI